MLLPFNALPCTESEQVQSPRLVPQHPAIGPEPETSEDTSSESDSSEDKEEDCPVVPRYVVPARRSRQMPIPSESPSAQQPIDPKYVVPRPSTSTTPQPVLRRGQRTRRQPTWMQSDYWKM